MKTYQVQVAGQTITLAGLTDDVKTAVTDIVRVRELRNALRLAKNELIDGSEFEVLKDSVQCITFVSSPVIRFIAGEEGLKTLLRAMATVNGRALNDAEAEALAAAAMDEGSDTFATVKLMFNEAVPKKAKTPPAST